MIVCIAHAKVGYRQAIFNEKPRARESAGVFLATAILSFLIIASTGTGDAIAKGLGP